MNNSWKKYLLEDLITIKHGYAFKGEYFVDDKTNYYLVTPGNFSIGGGFQKYKDKFYDGPVGTDYILNPNDLIVTMTDLSKSGDTLGFPALVPKNENYSYLHNQRIGLVEIKDTSKINKIFLYYLMRSREYQKYIVSTSSGATVKHTSPSKIGKFRFFLPSLQKQKDIGNQLHKYELLINNNNHRIQILEEIAQRIYEEWFVNFKFPGHEKVKMVDSELGKIPEGWHFVKASEVIDFDPKTSVDRNLENKYLPMGSISESSMIISNIEMRKGNSGSKFQNKDTLLARISPSLENGKTGFVNFLKKNETAFGSTEFIVMRSKSICPEYVYCLARSSKFRDTAIKSMRGATGRQRVQRDALENFRIALPNDSKLVNEFQSVLEPMFDQIYLLNKKNEVLVKTRDLLLPRLISGEIEL